MSGAGAPKIKVDASGLQVAIVVTSWHDEITGGLLAGAEKALVDAGNTEYEIWRVPGAFELPLGAQKAIDAGADAVIALGVVIQGETPHFDYVCAGTTDGLMRVMLDSGIPIGFGLLTVNTEAEALARAGLPNSKEDKGAEAVEAAILMARL
ncbi:6,7-dimethyl-8-ribityllumazine synthase [Candidatus Rhodoluna planktonica]|uniref:6,7-dimethyl-8-ribityllumazine synthase n=1 Tax=Candidatus Rhodoluna planktonica TaxID=535712 RepID=A0A1D9E018_9MICO|nr:6,7-dimethyl-8-ribityllumazine synthase [Candidatus Rhodoluna planktonica]AOY56422.1 6,7-dimethyl-8-ribityllumazine synthase [Candidatus Rhodoluna planktonica]